MIEKETLYVVSCDSDCFETHEWHPGLSRQAMIRVARDNGWGFLYRDRRLVAVACPRHNDFDNGE